TGTAGASAAARARASAPTSCWGCNCRAMTSGSCCTRTPLNWPKKRQLNKLRRETMPLYDATTGEKLRAMPGPKAQVRAEAFSPDGSMVGGTTTLGLVHVWEVATGRLRHVLPGRSGPSAWGWSLAFSADGKTLATGWGEGEVILFDVATGWEVADLRV